MGRRFTIPAPSTADVGWSLLRRVQIRDGFACVYCGARHVSLTIDHVRPKAHFPSTAPAALVNAPSNLVTACAECNHAKGPQSLRGFAETLRGRGLPAPVVAAVMRRARTAMRRSLPLTVVP